MESRGERMRVNKKEEKEKNSIKRMKRTKLAKVKFHLWHLFHIWHSQGVKSKRWPVCCMLYVVWCMLLVWQLQLQLRETTCPLICSLFLSVKEWRKKKKTCPSRFGQASHPMNLFIMKYKLKMRNALCYIEDTCYVCCAWVCIWLCIWVDHRWLLVWKLTVEDVTCIERICWM